MGIFSKLFLAVMAHIIMENADEKIKLLLNCFQLKIVDILLSFFLLASLYKPVAMFANMPIFMTVEKTFANHSTPSCILLFHAPFFICFVFL